MRRHLCAFEHHEMGGVSGMPDIDLELRMQLMRARPELSRAHAESLIRGVAADCLEARDDAVARGEDGDFVTFCHVDGVALVAVFRDSGVEFLAFAADESFIHEAEHLSMAEVGKFLELARSRFHAPEEGLMFPMSQALPWMEQHRKAEREGESKHT